MPNELKIGRVYRHFKGDFYLVEAVANDSETGEPFVVYRKLYGDFVNSNPLWKDIAADTGQVYPWSGLSHTQMS